MARYWTLLFASLLVVPLASSCTPTIGREVQKLNADEEEIEYVTSHDLKPHVARAIERGQVVIGMKSRDVRFLRGEPKQIKEESGRTVWVYGTVTRGLRVTFENGTVAEMPK